MAHDRSPRTRERANAERKKTAQELADMIQAEMNVGGTIIKVHPDNVYGWHSPKRSRLAEGGRNNRRSVAR
jgi:hypothetical protein